MSSILLAVILSAPAFTLPGALPGRQATVFTPVSAFHPELLRASFVVMDDADEPAAEAPATPSTDDSFENSSIAGGQDDLIKNIGIFAVLAAGLLLSRGGM